MLSNILTIINFLIKYRLETLIICSIVFIVLFGIYCNFTGKTGNWSTDYFYPNKLIQKYKENRDKSCSKGENECKKFLEYILQKPFEKSRPKFLFNPETNHNLELDMFNIDLNLACEYNGRQHYELVPFFHKNGVNDLKKQIKHDQLKIDVCRKLGINLIIVPYYIPTEEISDFIYDELTKLDYV